jgi:hypothetical protein
MLPRFLILSLLISACVAPAMAQSSPDKNPFSSRSPQNSFVPPEGFRLHTPALSRNEQAEKLQPPFHWDALNLSHATPVATQSVNPTAFFPLRFSSRSTLAQNAAPCYSIRSYRFAREDPKSDATRFVGYSTCQPGAEFHIEDAVDGRSR